ncbi:hypothetical protein ACET3Z_000623 [Daucus carota]
MISSPNSDAEKDAQENLSLAGDGFDTVIKAKQAVEAACPGVVSCADILAIATRDVVRMAGGPSFSVELGRRDGLVSKASAVPGKLPKPSFNLKQLNSIFSKHNLTQLDMIALSGAHTLGVSRCDQFSNRLYSFSSSFKTDPSLDPEYAQQLIDACPKEDSGAFFPLDLETPRTFDNSYFKNLVAGKGLLSSDQVLFSDPASRTSVRDFASSPGDFNAAFTTAMKKLGRSGVKTGDRGQAGGPSFSVELGRRDGLVSKASAVPGKLPKPSFNLKQLNSIFSKHNLTQLDMIALSGAHTLGVSRCDQFSNRLHSFSSSFKTDPSLDPEYAQQLIDACPKEDSGAFFPLDLETPRTFDNSYFKNLVAGKGLLSSDQVLFSDPASRTSVRDFASSPGDFNAAFTTAMKKLGRSGVKTGDRGQVRKDCTAFNS